MTNEEKKGDVRVESHPSADRLDLPRPATSTSEADVSDAWDSELGGIIFNEFTRLRGDALYFAARLYVVKAMLRAMLDAERNLNGRKAI